MNMSMNKMSVELDKVFFKVNLTLLSIQGCTSSKCQQKVEIFIGQPKSQQFQVKGQQFLQLSLKGIPKNDIC